MSAGPATGVRLDRWLWAARFFKTRAQAKTAVESGKVEFHTGSQSNLLKPKPGKEVKPGDKLTIRRGWDSETVVITALSEHRGNATSARELYEETIVSIENREANAARRRMERAGLKVPLSRPSKRDRRELKKLKQEADKPGS